MSTDTSFRRSGLAVAALMSGIFSAGCGGGEFEVAPAKGKVVCDGRPMPVGSVTFSPVGEQGSAEPGKPATANVDADGTFVLTTYDPGDGAILGKHKVNYWPPEGNEDDEGDDASAVEEGSAEEQRRDAERAAKRKTLTYPPCEQTQPIEVEVTADGPNDFTIELTPRKGES